MPATSSQLSNCRDYHCLHCWSKSRNVFYLDLSTITGVCIVIINALLVRLKFKDQSWGTCNNDVRFNDLIGISVCHFLKDRDMIHSWSIYTYYNGAWLHGPIRWRSWLICKGRELLKIIFNLFVWCMKDLVYQVFL